MMLRLQLFRRPLSTLARGSNASPFSLLEDEVAVRRIESASYARFTRKIPSQIGILSMEAVERTARYLMTRGFSHMQAIRAISLHVMVCVDHMLLAGNDGYEGTENARGSYLIEWLRTLGLSDDKVNNVILRHPVILGFACEKLNALVQWYQFQGVPKSRICYIFSVFPEGVSFSLDNLNTKVNFLNQFGCSENQISRILTTAPQTLGYSVEKLRVNTEYLKNLGVRLEDLPAITARVPQYLGLKTSRIKETVDAIEEMFGTGAGLRALVHNSRIVMHNVSGMRRSYTFLRSIGFTKERLEQCTRFIMRDERRFLRPRVNFLTTRGENVLENVSWILMSEVRFIEKYSGYAAYVAQYRHD
ncbi:hypothetical protein CCR75_004574 [Bremia lactucae]|uniref:Uncharacterized protein n=1 Tax=Bremia lactucae TaxID=4779 RepID=A0A976FL04_BRELC|nr:hypothetical protein CCR75_004574 [Bremia lactucae]